MKSINPSSNIHSLAALFFCMIILVCWLVFWQLCRSYSPFRILPSVVHIDRQEGVYLVSLPEIFLHQSPNALHKYNLYSNWINLSWIFSPVDFQLTVVGKGSFWLTFLMNRRVKRHDDVRVTGVKMSVDQRKW